MKNAFFLITFVLFSFLLTEPVYAQKVTSPEDALDFPPPHERNFKKFGGKRIPKEDMDFNLVFVKFFEVQKEMQADILIDLFFTQVLNAESVSAQDFLINDMVFQAQQIQFFKNCKGIRIVIPAKDFNKNVSNKQNFSFKVQNIESARGELLPGPVEFSNCQLDSEFRYLIREKVWKRF